MIFRSSAPVRRTPSRRRRDSSATQKVLVLLAAGLSAAVARNAAADGDAQRGASLYRVYCTQCHGLNGDGYGVNTRDMAVLPRNHTDAGEMSARTDADLFKAIQGGGKAVNKSVLMPSWEGNLDEQDINDLIAYLRELCCGKTE